MKILINESQLKNLLKSHFGVDLTGKIKMITSASQVPYEFDKYVDHRYIKRAINHYGPIYLLTIEKKWSKEMFLYQKRDGGRVMIINTMDTEISEMDIMKKLGIEVLGLSVNNLIDEYLTEEPLNEQVTDETEDNIGIIIQSYLDMNLHNYYGIKRFLVDYNEQWGNYIINIFFDRQMAVDMGGGINMLIRRATNEIGNELTPFFKGINLVFHQHFED